MNERANPAPTEPLPEVSAAPLPRRFRWARAAFRRGQLLRGRWSLLLGCGVLALGGFIKLTSELAEGELDALDRLALQNIVALRQPAWNGSAVDLTALGSVTVLTLLCVVSGVLLFMQRDRLGGWQLVLAAIGGAVLSSYFKGALERARPDHVVKLVDVSSYSYPSGHSLAAASVYLTLAIIASRHLSARNARVFVLCSAVLLMSCIGCSRAYLGVHYPSDVAAGLLLGSGWSLLVSALFSFVRAKRV
jgi:undecaprenyl-diphosphatase